MTPEEQQALDGARALIEFGIPVFVARAALVNGEWDPKGGSGGLGYTLPQDWQNILPDGRVLDRWQPGDALCAVMGHGLDLLDVDPRNGGEASAAQLRTDGLWPSSYAAAATPSDGTHDFIASLGVGSRDGVLPGIDVKGGTADGGRGFAFLAPTKRRSKTTGELVEYRWLKQPDVEEMFHCSPADHSGRGLAELIAQSRPGASQDTSVGGGAQRVANHGAPIPRGQRHTTLCAYAGLLRQQDTPLADALLMMGDRWNACDQPADDAFELAEAEALLRDMYKRYPHGPSGTNGSSSSGSQGSAPASGDAAPAGNPLSEAFAKATFTIDDLFTMQPPVPYVAGMIDMGTVSMLYGASGSGKTFFSLDLAMATAHGVSTLGLTITPGPVVYVLSEGSAALRKRVIAWLEFHGNPPRIHELVFVIRPVSLMEQASVRAFVECYKPLRPVAIFIDTLARGMQGGDEISARDATNVMANVDYIRSETGASVILNHHPGKEEERGARGSSALRAAVDTEIRVSSSGTSMTVKSTKQRDHELSRPLELERLEVGESCALTLAVSTPSLTNGAALALESLRAIEVPGGVTPALWKSAAAENRVADSSFWKYRKSLLANGEVINLGTDTKPKYATRPLTGEA